MTHSSFNSEIEFEDGGDRIDNLQWDEGGMDSVFGVNEPEDVRTLDDSRCGS